MPPSSRLLRFQGARHPVRIVGCDEVADALGEILENWPHDEAAGGPARADGSDELVVRRGRSGMDLEVPWLESAIHHRDPVHLACDVIVHLINSFVRSNPDLLCLHAGAARIDGRLVVFPTTYRSGKSVLSAHLAMRGACVFTDDVLPVGAPLTGAEGGVGWPGIALGVAPRLRLPLPRDVSPAFEAFARKHAGPTGRRYRYLRLGADRLAHHGDTAPIGAFVFLDRSRSTGPAFAPAEGARNLRRLIERNFAREMPAPRLLERMEALFAETPCFTLAYRSAEAGAAALLDGLAGKRPAAAPRTRAREGAKAPDRSAARPAKPARPGQWHHAPNVEERDIQGELFIVNRDTDSIYALEGIGGAVWHLLDEPCDTETIVATLGAAFPDVGRERICADVESLLRALHAKGIVARKD